MLARVTNSACFLLLLMLSAFPSRAISQSISDTINELNETRDAKCHLNERLVTRLVRQIQSGASNGEKTSELAQGLSFLARETFWRSENTPVSLEALIATGKVAPELQPAIAEAAATANGELKYILFSNLSDPDQAVKKLELLIDTNENALETPNRFYVAQIKLTLAEYLSDKAFQASKDQDMAIPIPSGSDGHAKIHGYLRKSIELFSELAEFYTSEHESGNLYSRDIGKDFRYQVALLKFVTSDNTWKDELRSIVNDSLLSDMYGSGEPIDHVYIHRFLVTPYTPQENVASTEEPRDCSTSEALIGERVSTKESTSINRFFNPVQLALYTCHILESVDKFESATLLSASLSRFRNSDYRVVLGHFRGQEVRFSFLNKTELIAIGNSVIQEASKDFMFSERPDLESPCGLDAEVALMTPNANTIKEQSTGTDRGYIYAGENLNFVEATRLREAIARNPDLSEAYIIRPEI